MQGLLIEASLLSQFYERSADVRDAVQALVKVEENIVRLMAVTGQDEQAIREKIAIDIPNPKKAADFLEQAETINRRCWEFNREAEAWYYTELAGPSGPFGLFERQTASDLAKLCIEAV